MKLTDIINAIGTVVSIVCTLTSTYIAYRTFKKPSRKHKPKHKRR